ncbi:hypothetical protein ACFX2F_030325 [Malus domestica]
MLSPCPSPCRCFGTKRKRAISQHLVSIFRSGTNYLEPLPDCLPSLALEDKEKESKRWALGKIEERNRPPHLPRDYLPCRRNKQRRMQTVQLSLRIPNQFEIKAVESQQDHLSPKPDLRS